MVRITSFGQSRAPGVIQALVEDDRGAFLFDFGAALPAGAAGVDGLRALLDADVLPPLIGLYRDDLAGEESARGLLQQGRRLDAVDGVLVSHAHGSHAAALALLRDDIPVYSSVMTAAILKAAQDLSPSGREHETVFVYAGQDGQGPRQQPFTFLLTQNDSSRPQGEDVDTFPEVYERWKAIPEAMRAHGQPLLRPPGLLPQFSRDGLNGRALRHYPVDHSILGATAYAVETTDGWVCYTGDIRFHGAQPGLMEEFVAGFTELQPLALIVDGANTEGGVAPVTERDVHDRVLPIVAHESGLVVADFDAMDMERLLTFNGVAELTKRNLVLSLRDAYMLEAMGAVWRQFPALNEVETFRILDAPAPPSAGDEAAEWRESLRSRHAGILVSADAIRSDAGSYILRTSPQEIGLLETIGPAGGVYIRSRPPMATVGADIRRRIGELGMTAVGLSGADADDGPSDTLHSSGHASFDETLAMIRRIAPRYVIPVHTAAPELFAEALQGSGVRTLPPERGVTLTVS